MNQDSDNYTVPVFEKGYPSWEAVNQERYHEYIIRKTREERENETNK